MNPDGKVQRLGTRGLYEVKGKSGPMREHGRVAETTTPASEPLVSNKDDSMFMYGAMVVNAPSMGATAS